MVIILILLVSLAQTSESAVQCPDNSSFFDYEECDPNRRSQCPSGFTCRPGALSEEPNVVVHLCCDSSAMTVADWFTENDLSPTYIPVIPFSKLNWTTISELGPNAPSPLIRTGDELVALNFPSYVIANIHEVGFTAPPVFGGFLHVVTIMDPAASPFAIMFTANIPWNGGLQCKISNSQGEFSYFLSPETVPPSLSYRHQYVVMIYRTPKRISLSPLSALMGDCENNECFMTRSSVATQIGDPLAGTLFYLTTLRTPFNIGDRTPMRDQENIPIHVFIVYIACLLRVVTLF